MYNTVTFIYYNGRFRIQNNETTTQFYSRLTTHHYFKTKKSMYSPTDNNSTTTVTQTPHYYNTPTTPTDYDSAGEDSWVMTQTPPTDPLETPSPMFCDLDTISPESWILLGRPLNANMTCVKGRPLKRKRRPSPSTSPSAASIPRDHRLMIPRCRRKLFKDSHPPVSPPKLCHVHIGDH